MTSINRREFIKNAGIGSVSAVAGLAAIGLLPRRILGEGTSGFNRVAFRKLGSTGFKASEVSFGAMNMRDPELVHAAIDSGINYIDTAHRYMNGVNEQIIGQVMKTKRDKVFLTTKVPPRSPDEMLSMMETSLKRLQTDHVDLMLLHNLKSPDPALDDDTIKTFEKARQKGMCRFVGVSTHVNQEKILDAAVGTNFWEAVLVGYSCMSPPGVKGAIERARKAGLATIAMKNLLNTQTRPRDRIGDIRKNKTVNITATQALIKWVLDDPFVDTTILGMTSFEHLAEDLAIMGMKMSFDDHRTLHRYGKLLNGSYCHGVSGCTDCVDQCPKGVDVRDLNRCLGYAYGYGDIDLARENYRELPTASRIDVCGECTDCVVKCVNGLDLTQNIRHARELFA